MQCSIFDCPLLRHFFISGVAIYVCVCVCCVHMCKCVYIYIILVGITGIVSVKTCMG